MPRDKITVIGGGRKRGSGGSGGSSTEPDWRDDLVRDDRRKVKSTTHNLMLILEHDPFLSELFYLDEFANRVALNRTSPWPGGNPDEFTEIDATELSAWMGSPRRYEVSPKPDGISACVEAIARRAARHPVREYLEALTWDGVPRVQSMLVELLGADDNNYNREAAKCFMVSAVSRILWRDPLVRSNGAKVDFMLILEGNQGKGKTSVIAALFGAQWYAEAMESPSSKDFYQSLMGRWCVEIGEMDSFSKADVGRIKMAITSRFDTYRPSYGRIARSYRRECVFVGSTNENQYLRDPSGGRRFLPVRVHAIHVDKVESLRNQLWAEAVRMYHDGFEWWKLPPEAADEQEARFMADSWEEVLGPWLAGRAPEKHYPSRLAPTGSTKPEWTTTSELLAYALHIEVGKHSTADQMRVAKIMRRLGWEQLRRRWADGIRERRWVPLGSADQVPDDDIPF